MPWSLSSRRLFFLIILIFLAHSLFYFAALGYDAVDDAYISFRYAQNAILGHGLVFNPGERVEGFTNFLWTALMIPFAGAGLDVGRISIALGILFGLGTLWLTVRLAKAAQLPPAAGVLAALLLAVDGSFAIWAASGLETALFAFLITFGVTQYLVEQRRPEGVPASGIIFALAALTRPEAAAVFALTAAHQLAARWLREGRLFTRVDLLRAGSFALIFIPYWMLRWSYYHSFFPNSFYAKVAPGGPIAQLERGWHYLNQFVDVHLGWWIMIPAVVALAAAVVPKLFISRSGRPSEPRDSQAFAVSYMTLLVLAYSAYIVYVGGDWSVGRFFVPVLPLAYLLIATGLVQVYSWIFNRVPIYVGVAAVMVLVAALAFASSWNGEYGIYVRGFDAGRATEAREVMGRWLKANVSPGTWIAVDAAGQVPYYSGLPAIDMFGINDLHIGRLSVATLGQGTPGHEKFDLGYIIVRRPRFVIIYGNLFDDVTEYRRAVAAWTADAELNRFLTLYEAK